MAVRQASWIQASSHPADTDRLVLESLFKRQGVVKSADLAVTQNGTPNMSVNVAAGAVAIDGTESSTQGFYHFVNDAVLNVAISAAHATLPRIDLIVAKVQDAQYSGATNAGSIVAVTGTAAASPVAPAAPANSVILAQVAVAAATTSITNANITDVRTFAEGPRTCRAYRSTTQSIPNAAATSITFDNKLFDTDALWVPGSPTRLTFATAGVWDLTAGVGFNTNGTGVRVAWISLNGSDATRLIQNGGPPAAGDVTDLVLATRYKFSAGDFVELRTYQTSGGALSTATLQLPHLTAEWVGYA